MKKILIIGAGGQIPRFLIPMLKEQTDLELTLFGRQAEKLSYPDVIKISGNAGHLSDLTPALRGQDAVYMNFDDKAVTKVVVEAMQLAGVKRIIQAGVLSVYGEVVDPFAKWNR